MPDYRNQDIDDRVTLVETDVRTLKIIVNGNPDLDTPGLRARMEAVEQVAAEYKNLKQMMRGVWIGLGVVGISSISTLITVLSQVFGGHP